MTTILVPLLLILIIPGLDAMKLFCHAVTRKMALVILPLQASLFLLSTSSTNIDSEALLAAVYFA
jgi:hypothetical protein